MKSLLMKWHSSNLNLKSISLVLAIMTWYGLSVQQPILRKYYVPVCLCGENLDHTHYKGPDELEVWLQGTRQAFYHLDAQALIVAIDIKLLKSEKNYIPLNNTTLFLPPSIKLVDSKPSNVVISKSLKKEVAEL